MTPDSVEGLIGKVLLEGFNASGKTEMILFQFIFVRSSNVLF